ncbi:reverse transcriptase domain-containing protein, partial [Tanacetum coccineum]
PSQANYVLREIHEGSCSMHFGHTIRRCQSYKDRILLADNAQGRKGAYQSMSGMPSAQTRPKKSAGKIESDYISVAILQMRFGLPGEIISDNGKQFRDNPFRDWCEKLCIQQHFAFVKHPQTNRLVERANRSLGEGIKARLGKDNKNWLEEISHVLWAHRTMIKSSNGNTPFSLTYETEAVIPAEIRMPTFRTTEVDMAKNDEALEINLEQLEEKREQAAIREAKIKRQMEKYYNTCTGATKQAVQKILES